MQAAVKIIKSSPIGRLNRSFGNTGIDLNDDYSGNENLLRWLLMSEVDYLYCENHERTNPQLL